MKALHSIFHSFAQHLICLDLRDAIPELWRGAKGLMRAFRHRSEEQSAAARSAICELCPMFDLHWKTCGTPGEIHESITTPDGTRFPPAKIGCWCYLPLANHDPKKDCWARAKSLHIGWPDSLRPATDPEQ